MTPEIKNNCCNSRYEPLNEWFFPAPVFEDGRDCPVPIEAKKKYEEYSNDWLLQPSQGIEIPTVRLFPVKDEVRAGYIVQIGVFYPPPSEIK